MSRCGGTVLHLDPNEFVSQVVRHTWELRRDERSQDQPEVARELRELITPTFWFEILPALHAIAIYRVLLLEEVVDG